MLEPIAAATSIEGWPSMEENLAGLGHLASMGENLAGFCRSVGDAATSQPMTVHDVRLAIGPVSRCLAFAATRRH